MAFAIAAHPLYLTLTTLGLIALALAVGTCLFFREVEINRHMVERVLELETTLALQKTPPMGRMDESTMSEVTKEVSEVDGNSVAELGPTSIALLNSVPAKLGEFLAECLESRCEAKAFLSPSSAGVAEGSLAVVLEVEVERIGGADPNSPSRKQFIVYPNYEIFSEFNAERLALLEHKHFRFSRALPARIEFQVAKLHRPVGINLYLYDPNNNLIRHERKSLSIDPAN